MERRMMGLDIGKFFFSMMVILVHSGRLAENEVLHFILKSGIGRLAVPFFLVLSSYLYRKNSKKTKAYQHFYFKKIFTTYLLWSFLYIPYGLRQLIQFNIPFYLYPVAIIIGIGYLGTCYHLWYIPGVLFAIWILDYALKKIDDRLLIVMAFVLFSFGAIETYTSYLQGFEVLNIYYMYKRLFFTTRNGLFFCLIFVLLGFKLQDFEGKTFFCYRLNLKLFLSLLLLVIEGTVIFFNQGEDKNFIFASIPVVVFLVAKLKTLKITFGKSKFFPHLFTNYSSKIYFLHPLFLEFTLIVASYFGRQDFQGVPLFLITLCLTLFSIHLFERVNVSGLLDFFVKKREQRKI